MPKIKKKIKKVKKVKKVKPKLILKKIKKKDKETLVTKEISLSILNFISLFTTTDPRLSLVKNVHLIKK